MDIEKAYNLWAEQYDSNENKTRDLEATVFRRMLNSLEFESCLEVGCGTGKNTVWLREKSSRVVAVDFSEEMLAIARSKIKDKHVVFEQADILGDWTFAVGNYDLVGFSLVLEHIDDLVDIFAKASSVLMEKGWLYIGELHPYKQYSGSKARFEMAEGVQELTTYVHHLTDFINAGIKANLEVVNIEEGFDEDKRGGIPRILGILFQKK